MWQTFNALKEVNRPEEIDWKAIPSMQPVAWKTGTRYGFRDAWAVAVSYTHLSMQKHLPEKTGFSEIADWLLYILSSFP